ncbi:peptide ABC transporter substrate-binding protein [Actinacidiphila acididurans]|uniref:ABC transporter substrate-binding protein n=1 Tax=Actinacidiphila acididurans TaxID=2784346 RepID=A0ABS2TLA5_9ACTN|nr:ABC transporter substrate-binding protein [Actinacidiphila acididurans]MBM9504118.1 ABC transporter substrate-binding protein [Actinacidiphila acididurans]
MSAAQEFFGMPSPLAPQERGGSPGHSGPAVFRLALTEPTAIDPYRSQEVEGILVTKALFVGLLTVDGEGRLEPAVAHRWDCTDDGLTWTFSLRTDVRFSNGEPVDADSFRRAWSRACDPVAGSETTYHLAGVEGCADAVAGRTPELSGVLAPDPATLVVRLTAPDFEFDKKTLQPVFSPVPRVAGGALDPVFNDEPVGNGPFRLDGPWRHHEGIRLVRNEHWFGEPPALDVVEITLLDPADAVEREYQGFLDGRFDFARIPPQNLAEAARSHPDGFLEQDLAGVNYLLPFLMGPPMDRRAAREAVSWAIDRDAIIAEVFGGYRTRAASLVPPSLPGAHQPDLAPSCVRHDPELARKCAAEAGLSPGTALDLAYNTGAGHEPWIEAVARQLRTVLGLDVRTHAMTPRQLVEYRTGPDARGLCRAAWAFDYPTPDNVLFPLLHSSCTRPDADGVAHGDNEGRYVNPAFDAALERARGSRDAAERDRWFREAERIAVAEDLAIVPLWFRTHHRVFDAEAFTGVRLDFYGNPTLPHIRPVSAPPAHEDAAAGAGPLEGK